MKITAVVFAILSIIALTIEVFFFFGEFEQTGLRNFMVGQQDRKYFTSNVCIYLI